LLDSVVGQYHLMCQVFKNISVLTSFFQVHMGLLWALFAYVGLLFL